MLMMIVRPICIKTGVQIQMKMEKVAHLLMMIYVPIMPVMKVVSTIVRMLMMLVHLICIRIGIPMQMVMILVVACQMHKYVQIPRKFQAVY